MTNGSESRVKLYGVDTPERSAPCFEEGAGGIPVQGFHGFFRLVQ